MSGQVIGGRFEITDPKRDLLGRGGVGDVYRARDLHTGELVAIKALRPEAMSGTPDAIARFTREGEALRELNHPNIVRMVDAIKEDGRHYLVIEYVPGGSLRDLLGQRGGPGIPMPGLPIERTVEIALDIADALTRAHRLRIIHRDLKPSNVLLAEDGTPRLTDFGIAHVTGGPRLTGADRGVGTVDYMSPEACNLEPLDQRTDIWSFGVMLYEMLAGERPFGGDSPLTTLTAILTQPLPDLQRLCSDASDALVDLVYRMLEKDRGVRIPSVRLVGAELEAILGAISTRTGVSDTQHSAVSTRPHLHCVPAQVSAVRRPSLPTTSRFATPTPPAEAPQHNLPAQRTPFVGRGAELAELDRLLTDPNVRLVSILGVGGMGKTRLALEAAARQLGRYAHGVYFVSLAPLRSVEAIVPTVAEALSFTFYAAYGGGAAVAPRQQLLDYLRQKSALLLLDNYEHLLEGVDLVSDILQQAPEVQVLATSRASLNVQEEHLFHITGMEFPDWETPEDALDPTSLTLRDASRPDHHVRDASRYSAVKLFIQSARRVRPGYELLADDLKYVSRICRLVGGMPLGILLAAAWVEMLSPEEIAAEVGQSLDFLATDLSNVPERQRSMRAVFDYSWSRLPERQQAAMEALSVFRGGFTRAAAQEVTGASLRALMALVNRSLLRRAPTGRYEMHELLRQYAAEKLALSGANEANVHDRHAAYYAAVLQGWAADLKGPRQLVAIEEIRADVDNARAAWNWAVKRVQERAQVDWLDRALEGLCLFYEWDSHYEEGEAACRKAADRLGESAPHLPDGAAAANRLRVLAHALAWQGRFSATLGRSKVADRCFEHALAALDRAESSDPASDVRGERAFTLVCMAGRALYTDLERARQWAERSLETCRALGDRWGTAEACTMLGGVLFCRGEYQEARRRLEDSLSLLRALGDRREMVWAHHWLTWTLDELGQLEEAERVAREGVAVAQQVGDRVLVEWAKGCLCDALRASGRFAETRSLLEAYLAYGRERGDNGAEAWGWWTLGLSARHLGSYEEARAAAQAALTLSQESGLRGRVASSHMELGRLALAEGEYGAAQEWLQQSIANYRQVKGLHWIMGEALAALAHADRGLGQTDQAREHFDAALRIAAETHSHNAVLQSLPAMALLLIDSGEIERAVELYALASRYGFVANSRWFEDVAGRYITAAAATLPPDAVTAAQERGRALDLWATAEELLAELEAE